jgi:DcmR-like sensory protein
LAVSAISPVIHSVHLYTREEALIQRLQGIIAPAVSSGTAVLIVCTDDHRQQLVSALAASGLDCSVLETQGRLRFHDTQNLLDSFMVDGFPDREKFFSVVGALVDESRQSAWNAQRGVTVFGEMVAVLWEQGNHVAALQLEALWNDLLYDREFHLHCAYPRKLFRSSHDGALMRAICDVHSHVVGQVA